MDESKWCSGFERAPNGALRCKHGHTGPGTVVCMGSRYPGNALAPCEREDLPFDEVRKCISGWSPAHQEPNADE